MSTEDPIAEMIVAEGLATQEQVDECLALIDDLAAKGVTPLPTLVELLGKKGFLKTAATTETLRPETSGAVVHPEDLPDAVAEAVLDPGNRFGHYVRVQMIGTGGMGEVWKAWDVELRRWVALKFLKHPDVEELARFRREAQTAAKLTHPNIAAIYEANEQYLAMQFIEGQTLENYPRQNVRELVRILRDAALAVHYAHDQKIIHRDLKPGNLMVDHEHRAFVMDFGMAKQTDVASTLSVSGMIFGTPYYMAPEQALSRPTDARSDVYGLGATLYELLTDHPPFQSEHVYETLKKVIDEEPVPVRRRNPRINDELETIVMKCLEKDPARRYASAEALAQDLARWLDGEPIEAHPASALYRLRKQLGRRKGLVALAGAAVVLSSLLLFVMLPKLRAVRAELSAEQQSALKHIRLTAKTCLEGALRLRRAGVVKDMEQFAVPLEEAFHEVTRRVPDLAEPYYLRGRMMRALMNHDESLKMQEEALRRKPDLAAALYERIVLNSKRYRDKSHAAFEQWNRQEAERIRGNPKVAGRFPAMGEIEAIDPELRALREAILSDIKKLESLPSELGEGHRLAAKGILAAYSGSEQAVDILRQATEKDSSLEEAFQALGEAAPTMDERILWLTRGLEQDRGYVPHLLERARLWRQWALSDQNCGKDPTPHYQKALEDFTRILELLPTSVEAQVDRGEVLCNWGDYARKNGGDPTPFLQKALEDYNEVLKADPARMEALDRRGAVQALWAFHQQRHGGNPVSHYEQALADFDKVLQKTPTWARVWVNRALACVDRSIYEMNRGHDPVPYLEESLKSYDQALTFNASNPEAWMGRASVWANWGLYEHRQGRDPTSFYQKAIDDCTRSLEVSPSFLDALLHRAATRINWGVYELDHRRDPLPHYQKAIEEYDQVLRVNPSHSEAYLSRGMVQVNIGNVLNDAGEDPTSSYDKGIADYDKALELNSSNAETWMRRGLTQVNYGHYVQKRGDDPRAYYEKATEDYGKALKVNPGYAEAWSNRGEAWASLGLQESDQNQDPLPYYEKAIQDYRKALELNPVHAETWLRLGHACWNQGFYYESQQETTQVKKAYAQAVRSYRKALEINAGMADRIGRCLETAELKAGLDDEH